MFDVTVVRGRARAALLVTLLTAGALHGDAAVLPLADDLLVAGVGSRGSLLDAPISEVAGQWVGRTTTGRVVSLVLRVSDGGVAGDATLEGVVPDAKAGPRPLVTPVVHGRTMAFAVQPGPCAKALTHGVLTFVSSASAQLDLHAGSTPISVRLSKIG